MKAPLEGKSGRNTPNGSDPDDQSRPAARKGIALRDRILLGILVVLAVAWLATWPLRTRLNQETARIDAETAKEAEKLRAGEQLKQQEADARRRLVANPRDFDARMALAAALARRGQFREELENLEAARQIRPDSPLPHAAKAELYDTSGLPDLAIDELRQVLALDPNDVSSLALLAYKYVAVGWNREAEAMLERAIAKRPDDVRLHVTLALVAFQNNQSAVAEQHLLAARRLVPNDASVAAPLAEVYRHAQRYADALRIIDETMPHIANKQALLLERARIFVETERPDDAINAANQILATSPDALDALYLRAVGYKMKGDTASAIRDFETVRARDSRIEQTLLLLGQLYVQTGHPEKGKPLLDEYNVNQGYSQKLARLGLRVTAQPNDWKSHFDMGEYYLQGGSYPRAIVELKRALELKPDNQDTIRLLVKALEAKKRTQEAASYAARLTSGG